MIFFSVAQKILLFDAFAPMATIFISKITSFIFICRETDMHYFLNNSMNELHEC